MKLQTVRIRAIRTVQAFLAVTKLKEISFNNGLDITEKTNNVTNAFMFFNLTTGFQFSELGNRLTELETQISNQKSESSNRVRLIPGLIRYLWTKELTELFLGPET